MLQEIHIKNFAIIDSLDLEFNSGLNILSGETGAGKSIILKTLSLLMGEKSSPNTVREGSESAIVEGLFDLNLRDDIVDALNELDIPTDDNQLIVRRVISTVGKNRVFLNGLLCNLTTLRQVVSPLIDINGDSQPLIEMTGQHENKILLERNSHLNILDIYCDKNQTRREMELCFKNFTEAKKYYENLLKNQQEREQQLDFLSFQSKKFRELNLAKGDIEKIEKKYNEVRTAKKKMELHQDILSILESNDQSIIPQLSKVKKLASELDGKKYEEVFHQLSESLIKLEDSAYEYNKNYGSLKEVVSQSKEIDDRMSKLRKLQKKYGLSEKELLEAADSVESELEQLKNYDSEVEKLNTKMLLLHSEAQSQAKLLNKLRVKKAKELVKKVNKELSELNMKGVEFDIQIDTDENQLGKKGIDRIEFVLRNGKKSEFRSLSKTASGGELSRILLAIKKITGNGQKPRTYLFDEVDAGVSGKTALNVGQKLKQIAQGQQVVCVTHLPQVAAFSDAHFSIEKENTKEATRMKVLRLSDPQKQQEIARLISGEKPTNSSLKHAAELMSQI